METLEAWVTTYLDPQVVGQLIVDWSGRIAGALLIFVIGRMLIRSLSNRAAAAMRRVGMDATLSQFLGNLVYIALLVLLALTVFKTLGVDTINFIAILGAAGLAIGLALKDSLSNFSSGVMLVFFRPFKVGDQIEAAGVNGVVESMGIFNVVLKTGDNRIIHVPNSLIYGGTITNFHAESTRRVDLTIGIGYDADIPQAKSVIAGVIAAEARVLQKPAPDIAVQEIAPGAVTIGVKVWVQTGDAGGVRGDLLERIKRALDKYGLSIPAEQRRLAPAQAIASK